MSITDDMTDVSNDSDDSNDSGISYECAKAGELYRLACGGKFLFGAAIGASDSSSGRPGPNSKYFPNLAIGQNDDNEISVDRATSPAHYHYHTLFAKDAKKEAQEMAREAFGKSFNLSDYREAVGVPELEGEDFVLVHESDDENMDIYFPRHVAEDCHEFAVESGIDNWHYNPNGETADSDDSDDSEDTVVFTDISGVGPVAANRLGTAGFTPETIRDANPADLCEVKGIGPALAEKITGESPSEDSEPEPAPEPEPETADEMPFTAEEMETAKELAGGDSKKALAILAALN